MSIPALGIDPGVNGGLCLMGGRGAVLHREAFVPGMTHAALVDVVDLGLDKMHAAGGMDIFVEKVGSMPTDSKRGTNTFGRVDGLIRGAVLMWVKRAGPGFLHDVYPMMWQAKLECLSGGNKNVTKNRATELWPAFKWTHATADAALIAEYGRRYLAERQR